MKIGIEVTNIKGLEIQLRSGLNNTFKALFRNLDKDVNNFGKNVVKSVANSPQFAALMTDPILRAQLGMPRKTFKLGSDTDGDDLIEELSKFKHSATLTGRTKEIKLVFPTIRELSDKLQRNLSRIGKTFQPGPRQSWFSWWEFGNAGETQGFTLTLRNVARLDPKKKRNINDIIRERSRSGFGIQVFNVLTTSVIEGRGLITKTYTNYAQVFPAYIGSRAKKWLSNKSLIGRFFSRGRTS